MWRAALGVSRIIRDWEAPRSRYPSSSRPRRWWWTADVEASPTARMISRTDGGTPLARIIAAM